MPDLDFDTTPPTMDLDPADREAAKKAEPPHDKGFAHEFSSNDAAHESSQEGGGARRSDQAEPASASSPPAPLPARREGDEVP